VEGLLREPWKKNMFTPENSPQTNEFYFPDVEQMARITGSQAVWIEETMGQHTMFRSQKHVNTRLDSDLLKAWDREARGIPIGRPAEVNLRNNHTQYIFTWYVQTTSLAPFMLNSHQVRPCGSHVSHVMDGYQETSS
jgi:surfeit locus 1 family protein